MHQQSKRQRVYDNVINMFGCVIIDPTVKAIICACIYYIISLKMEGWGDTDCSFVIRLVTVL